MMSLDGCLNNHFRNSLSLFIPIRTCSSSDLGTQGDPLTDDLARPDANLFGEIERDPNVETPRATLPTRIKPVELTLIGEQPDSIKHRSATFLVMTVMVAIVVRRVMRRRALWRSPA
jgi:hypothetical protein